MIISVGIALALVTMLCWGFGDFLIQKTARKDGSWETLFVITLFGAVILAPFCWGNFLTLFDGAHNAGLWIVFACGFALFIAAMFDFQGMKLGKLAIIEPLWSIEIIIAAFLSYFILRENLSFYQILLIVILIVCFILLSIKETGNGKETKSIKLRHFFVEKGVWFAVIGTTMMGVSDFFMGWGARVTDPLVINFAANIIMAVISGGYLLTNGRVGKLIKDIKTAPLLIFSMSIFDNGGWIAYAFAMSLASIGVVTALTESSIIVAVTLALILNKEKLQRHQWVGLVGSIVCIVMLSLVTSG